MQELLTVREVQDLLKVDRITVYRMLKDGRLTGIKIGQQWRFSRDEVDYLIASPRQANGKLSTSPSSNPGAYPLPLHCTQLIQDLFADMAGVPSITLDPAGEELTAWSNPCALCELVRSTPEGRAACARQWRKAVEDEEGEGVCHAGLRCASSTVMLEGEPVAAVAACGYYERQPDPQEEWDRMRLLGQRYGISAPELARAASSVPVLNERHAAEVTRWLGDVARTFENLGRERAVLVGKLRSIAAMSALE